MSVPAPTESELELNRHAPSLSPPESPSPPEPVSTAESEDFVPEPPVESADDHPPPTASGRAPWHQRASGPSRANKPEFRRRECPPGNGPGMKSSAAPPLASAPTPTSADADTQAPPADPAEDWCFMIDVVNTHAHRTKQKQSKPSPWAATEAKPKKVPAYGQQTGGKSRGDAGPGFGPGAVIARPEEEEVEVPIVQQTNEEQEQKKKARNLVPGSFRLSPAKLVWQDLVTFARHAKLVPQLGRPALEVQWPQAGWGSTLGSIALVGASVPLTLLAASGAVACLPAIGAFYALTWAANKVQGAPTRESKRHDNGKDVEGHEREKWFFVNGIATAPNEAQNSIDYLHKLTGRPVTALLNRTLGFWFDLIECVLQRDLHQMTASIRDGYGPLREAIMNPKYDRIVIIGHSQGGIIVSGWADQLLADFGDTELSKVEIYTFASAANHFSRAGVTDGLENDSAGPWAHVEHFANWRDFVAQFGVLSHLPDAATKALEAQGFKQPGKPRKVYGQFAGRIFVRGKSGHNFLMHYLYPGKSILDEPMIKENSYFATYIGGGNLLPPKKAT